MRINKRLSNYGYCSRKEVNRWILEKRIVINGKLAFEGQWTTDEDDILLDEKKLSRKQRDTSFSINPSALNVRQI